MLRAADISFGYGASLVLRDVSLAIAPGSIVGILGPNGSGKTTLLRVLAGVLVPSSGRVLLDDVDLHTIPRRRLARRIAVVPQETHLTFDYRVIELALMGRYPYLGAFEFEGPDDVEAALRALDATGTRHLSQRSFETLSGGERQRVVIASALAQFEDVSSDARARHDREADSSRGPRVLLLDEPTASLDVHYQLEIVSLLRQIIRPRPLSIVVSTHDLNFAAAVCGELVLLRDGQVIDAGPTASVLRPPAIRALYGIEADVTFHEAAGHLTVVPLKRAAAGKQTAK